jgi:hypothetical protein
MLAYLTPDNSGIGWLRVVSLVGANPEVRPKGEHCSEVKIPTNPEILFKPYSFSRRYRQRDTGFPADNRGAALSHFLPGVRVCQYDSTCVITRRL